MFSPWMVLVLSLARATHESTHLPRRLFNNRGVATEGHPNKLIPARGDTTVDRQYHASDPTGERFVCQEQHC